MVQEEAVTVRVERARPGFTKTKCVVKGKTLISISQCHHVERGTMERGYNSKVNI